MTKNENTAAQQPTTLAHQVRAIAKACETGDYVPDRARVLNAAADALDAAKEASGELTDERQFIIDAVARAKVLCAHPEAATTIDIGHAVLAAFRERAAIAAYLARQERAAVPPADVIAAAEPVAWACPLGLDLKPQDKPDIAWGRENPWDEKYKPFPLYARAEGAAPTAAQAAGRSVVTLPPRPDPEMRLWWDTFGIQRMAAKAPDHVHAMSFFSARQMREYAEAAIANAAPAEAKSATGATLATPVAQADEVSAMSMLSGALNHARDALRFYADQGHFHMHQPDEWDTVSGEPQNFYEDSNNTATVEDGSVAKLALENIAGVERYASAAAPVVQAEVKVERGRVWIVKGNQSFMLAYEPDKGDDPAEMEAYAAKLRAALSTFTPYVNPVAQAVPEGAQPIPVAMIEIGKLIATQDNRYTEAPMFVVEQKTPVISDSDYSDCRVEWRETENGDYALASAERAKRLEALFRAGRETPGWRRYEVTDIWTFVTACLTEQGCKDYLARNGHNLRETRIYAYGSYRNEEFRAIRNWLMSLAAPTITAASAQPIAAWMTEDGDRVVSAKTMEGARRDGGAMLSSLRPYTVALVKQASAQTAPGEVRDQALEEAAKLCESEICACCWKDGAEDAALYLAEEIRALKGQTGAATSLPKGGE